MRKNSCGKVDILKTDYDKNISKIPELIGKHPGVMRYHGGRSKDKGRQ
jgi:hypothetical protein